MTEELWRRVNEDYGALKEWLPPAASSLLDIGCGVFPIMDICIANHYGGAIDIHLMDGDVTRLALKRHGFNLRTKAWSNRHIGLEFVREHLPTCNLYDHPPDPNLKIPSDIIISRRAWGHHFPIGTYISLAKRSLRPGGRIITDLRIGRGDGMQTLVAHGFRPISGNIEVRSIKCERYVFERAGQ